MHTQNHSFVNVNPQYRYALPDWKKCADCFSGEREIKSSGELYLPKTEGQLADSRFGQKRYEAYKERAVYHNYFASSVLSMLGVMHREPPEAIELPERIHSLHDRCSSDGLSLAETLRRINMFQLVFGRCGVLLDVPGCDTSPNAVPVMSIYSPDRIPDWNTGSFSDSDLSWVILDESGFEHASSGWSFRKKYRICSLSPDGEYYTRVLDQEEYSVFDPLSYNPTEEEYPLVRGKRLTRIPFVFANAANICTDVQKPPLLPLANLCLAIYRGEADYRHALFMQAQSTLFLKGFHLDDPPMMGAGNYIHTESPDASGSFLEISGNGLQEMRSAQNDLHSAAKEMGLSLDGFRSNESGESLKTRMEVKTSMIRTIAETGASAIRFLLRTAAEWCSADPEQITFRPNTDFSESGVAASEVRNLWDAKSAGLPLSSRSIHDWLRKNDFTDIPYDQEMEDIRKESR